MANVGIIVVGACLITLWLRVCSGKPYWKGRLSTVDLLVLASLDQLIFYWKYYLLFYKTSYLNEEVNCTEPSSSSVSVPWFVYTSTTPHLSANVADFASIGLSLDKPYKNKPGANVIKLFTAVIYHHSMVIPSFCEIKKHYLGNYCGMAVNYWGICVINVIKPILLT